MPGRPPTIDREAVFDTALALLDAEGVEALTMRRLASELGVSAMAPYRHVGSKDELLMVLVDRLAARLEFPPRPPDPKGALLVLWPTMYDSLAAAPLGARSTGAAPTDGAVGTRRGRGDPRRTAHRRPD